MKTDTPSAKCSTSSRERFFESNYTVLRERPPMKWMGRLFAQVTDGQYPRLVDLPTAAGKTDVAVIWALALAWYGLDTGTRHPVPRRLVWVVNRRVLVQQVFNLAEELQEKLSTGRADPGSLADVREGLARLSGDGTDVFRFVQLRGQLVDDREWSVAPSVPRLIIGTVDQIGSRLFFQGYGLGKWSRPMQAAMLGVDAWICVDEAHLVPAFVLTLRQMHRLAADLSHETPQVLCPVFERLPFWMTELSATPALPPPSPDLVFRLLPADEDDPPLKDRVLAARTRRVRVAWVRKSEEAKQVKQEEVLERAVVHLAGKAATVAVFVRAVKDADKIYKGLNKQFKGRVLLITGRVRGYERDRLQSHPVFKRFRPPEDEGHKDGTQETVYLVGTAAAEVGLDADAEAVVCDFGSLTTLIQRLGRLDRRGRLSRRAHNGQGEPPTMRIIAKRAEAKREIEERILKLARELRATENELPVSLLVGTPWNAAIAKQEPQNPKERETDEQPSEGAEPAAVKDKKAKKLDPDELVITATWAALLGRRLKESSKGTITRSPSSWLKCPISRVTLGPVAVPPLTPALVEHWAATSSPRSAFVPVHPFLYGILPDEEGTPLVGVAFRLEMDALFAGPKKRRRRGAG